MSANHCCIQSTLLQYLSSTLEPYITIPYSLCCSIMSSRKRQSDTTVVASNNSTSFSEVKPKPRLKVRIKRFHGVAKWTWNAGSEDEVCGICQSAYEGVAPGVKYPGDECPVVYGKCGHAYVMSLSSPLCCLDTYLTFTFLWPFLSVSWQLPSGMCGNVAQ